jgi:hypothetical protein
MTQREVSMWIRKPIFYAPYCDGIDLNIRQMTRSLVTLPVRRGTMSVTGATEATVLHIAWWGEA